MGLGILKLCSCYQRFPLYQVAVKCGSSCGGIYNYTYMTESSRIKVMESSKVFMIVCNIDIVIIIVLVVVLKTE